MMKKIIITQFFLLLIICHASTVFASLESGIIAFNKNEYKIAFKEFESAAKLGSSEAQVKLAFLYEEGLGVTKKYNEALYWYRNAANAGNPNAMMSIANFYANGFGVNEDMILAVNWLRKSAKEGQNSFLIYDGEMLTFSTKNKQLKKKITQAQEYFRRKAEQGDVIAQVNLGYMYFNLLIGVSENTRASYSQAEGWFLKAAEKGNVTAQRLLGYMSEFELITERNQIQAEKWYQLAASQGNASSQYRLASIYAGAVSWKYSPEKSVPVNFTIAKKWALKSAKQGYVPGQSLIGTLLISKGNSDEDYAEALIWLHKAAKKVDTNAQITLGDVYFTGKSVSQDYTQAISWYRKAIDLSDNGIAYARLGKIYEEGLSVPKDPIQALKLYEKALKDVNDISLNVKVAIMYENGIGTKKNENKAFKHYASAAISGDIDSMKKLQEIFEKGLLGQKIDVKKSVYWQNQIEK